MYIYLCRSECMWVLSESVRARIFEVNAFRSTQHTYNYVWNHDTVYETEHMHIHTYTPNYVMEITKWHKTPHSYPSFPPTLFCSRCFNACLVGWLLQTTSSFVNIHAQNMLQIGYKREISNTSDPKIPTLNWTKLLLLSKNSILVHHVPVTFEYSLFKKNTATTTITREWMKKIQSQNLVYVVT